MVNCQSACFRCSAAICLLVQIGCCTPEEVQKNVQTVLEAFGEQTATETQVLREVQTILEPIQGKTWPSGLPENN